MNTGFQHSHPHQNAQQRVRQAAAHAQPVCRIRSGQAHSGKAQTAGGDIRREENRNHQHRRNIVHNGQRGQKNGDGGRNTAAQQRQYANGKCNVGGHRYRPPALASRALIDKEVNRSRKQYPAQCPGNRQRGLLHRRQFARQHLALNFEPDRKEENGHQPVVDQVMQGQPELELSSAGRHHRVQNGFVRGKPWRVRPSKGGHCTCQQQYPARCFVLRKFSESNAGQLSL